MFPVTAKASFEPKIVPKGVRRLEGFNANIVALYARGLSTRDIRSELARMYGVDVSPALVIEGHRRDRRGAHRMAEPPS
jgi:transposase-like protein